MFLSLKAISHPSGAAALKPAYPPEDSAGRQNKAAFDMELLQ